MWVRDDPFFLTLKLGLKVELAKKGQLYCSLYEYVNYVCFDLFSFDDDHDSKKEYLAA